MVKKGMEQLAMVVITLAAAIVLALFVGSVIYFTNASRSTESCRKCLELANHDVNVRCDCIREELEIKYDDIAGSGGKIDQDLAHKKIADAMYNCLYKFHSGELDPAADYSDITDESICRPCYQITFDRELEGKYDTANEKIGDIQKGRQWGELSSQEKQEIDQIYQDYTITSPISYLNRPIKAGSKISYWEYLYKEEVPENFASLDLSAYTHSAIVEGSTIQLRYFREGDTKILSAVAAVGAGIALSVILPGSGAIILAGEFIAGAAGGGALTYLGTNAIKDIIEHTSDKTTQSDLNSMILAFPDKNAFKNCVKCEDAAGNVIILPPGTDYSLEWVIPEPVNEKWPVCSITIG